MSVKQTLRRGQYELPQFGYRSRKGFATTWVRSRPVHGHRSYARAAAFARSTRQSVFASRSSMAGRCCNVRSLGCGRAGGTTDSRFDLSSSHPTSQDLGLIA